MIIDNYLSTRPGMILLINLVGLLHPFPNGQPVQRIFSVTLSNDRWNRIAYH